MPETPKQHGGKRPGAGRKRRTPGGSETLHISVPAEVAAWYRARGLRTAAEVLMRHMETDKDG